MNKNLYIPGFHLAQDLIEAGNLMDELAFPHRNDDQVGFLFKLPVQPDYAI
jgi:hypothetical protein